MAYHKENALTAHYAAPGSRATFEQCLPALPMVSNATSTNEKTEYLAALRMATTHMQNQINAFLTEKMEEDKKKDMATGDAAVHGVSDEKAEEMYGEEADEVDG